MHPIRAVETKARRSGAAIGCGANRNSNRIASRAKKNNITISSPRVRRASYPLRLDAGRGWTGHAAMRHGNLAQSGFGPTREQPRSAPPSGVPSIAWSPPRLPLPPPAPAATPRVHMRKHSNTSPKGSPSRRSRIARNIVCDELSVTDLAWTTDRASTFDRAKTQLSHPSMTWRPCHPNITRY